MLSQEQYKYKELHNKNNILLLVYFINIFSKGEMHIWSQICYMYILMSLRTLIFVIFDSL